jgi:tetratricopeptide (TPR) repeat protein
VIQEFEISITAVGGDQYLVRTENVAKGVQLAEEKVRWPVAQWLEKTKSFMHDPLLGLLQGQQRHTLPTRAAQSSPRPQSENANASTLVHLGQTLHRELFRGQLHDSWITAQGVAQNRQDLLRLRIGMKDSRLQQLPWEALHAGTRPLATGTDVIFSRYILDRRQGHSVHLAKRNDAEKALRILMVIASPDDQERLELKQEVYHLQSELHPVGAEDDDTLLDVQLKILEQPGRAELTQELDRGNYQVLHYAGHSNLGNAGGDLYLVSRQTGLSERLSGEDLAGLLVNNGIKLAVFNSCRGGYSSSGEQGWQERNLAQALVNRGMPSVIAMAERIPDHVAITFTQLLYRNLKKGQSIDLSLNRTRQGLISAYGSHQFYWALPTLYMQPSFNGYLLKTASDRENASLLDANNDPFGGMFSEPNLANIDWPIPRREDSASGAIGVTTTKGTNLGNNSRTHLGKQPGTNSSVDSEPVSSQLRFESPSIGQLANAPVVNNVVNKVVDNNDAQPADAGVNELSTPLGSDLSLDPSLSDPISSDLTSSDLNSHLSSDTHLDISRPDISRPDISDELEIDEELRVPEAIETPSGFYGEQAIAIDDVSEDVFDTAFDPTFELGGENAAGTAAITSSAAALNPVAHGNRKEKNTPDLIGERLQRSHTLHTKLLTVPGIASMALVTLLSIATIGWLQKARQVQMPQSTSASSLSLPAQVEVALNNNNLDAATVATKSLIDNGDYTAALSALDAASNQQQKDAIVSFLKGRAQWELEKQGSLDFSAADAMRSWTDSLESESDWMEIAMALGFSQYAVGREELALESWQRAIDLTNRQPEAQYIYFSEQPADEYILNAYAGVAMSALALSKIETNPEERNRLLQQATAAYTKVINEAPEDFNAKSLGNNWLWVSPAIADWGAAKQELSKTIQ